jgi:O-antigen/teichoic acid export membrane protein
LNGVKSESVDPKELIENDSQMPAAYAPESTVTGPAPEPPSGTGSLARGILTASSALGVATVLERGLGFIANFLGARIGGAGTFGAYSLALTTANSIASYAGGGIGSTATRFSGEFNKSNNGYGAVVRALLIVSSVSAVLATSALAFGAGPFARGLLHNPGLTDLLRWSAFSAGAMVLLECCRGFFVGQREYSSLLLLSALTGIGMVIAVPWAAAHGATAMVVAQGTVVLSAFAVCGLLVWRRLPASASAGTERARSEAAGVNDEGSTIAVTRQIWRFGIVQLAGMAGLNAAGWWMASLIARADVSLVDMGLFAVANQLRNMAAMGPGLLTQSSFGMLAGKEGHSTPRRIISLCTFGAAFSSIALAGMGILVLPWALPFIFGPSYRAGVLAGSLGLATAIVHMSAAPAAARLTVLSLRATGAINTAWAILVCLLATLLVPRGGAVAGLGIYLAMHLLSAVLVMLSLARKEGLPTGLAGFGLVTAAGSAGLALLAALRQTHPEWTLWITAAIFALVVAALAAQLAIAASSGWLPSATRIAETAGCFRWRGGHAR